MDAFDQASELETRQRQMALSNHFKANQSKLVVSETHCVECGTEIPEARQKAVKGCQHCVHCKSLSERGKL